MCCACEEGAVHPPLQEPSCLTDPGLYGQTACATSVAVSAPLSNAGGTHPVEPVEQFPLHHSAHLMVHRTSRHITDMKYNMTCCTAAAV